MGTPVSEAKMKWCPFGIPTQDRADRSTEEGGETASSRNYGTRCIVDECMAWRWTNDGDKTHGYCGIAGQP